MKKNTISGVMLLITLVMSVIASDCAQKPDLPKKFAFNKQNDFKKYSHFHGGAGSIKLKEMFDSNDYKTGHLSLRLGIIPPQSSIGEYTSLDADEVYIIIKGTADITVNGRTGKIIEGTMVPCKMGESIGLYNSTDENILFAWLITPEKKGIYNTKDTGNDLSDRKYEKPCPFTSAYMKEWVNPNGYRSHEGKGVLKSTRGKIGADYFKTRFLSLFMVLPPDCSIGYHRHQKVEEIYMLMNGQARGTVNDVTMDMGTGDVSLCSLGDAHGIYNNGKEDIFIYYTMKSIDPNGKFDAENLGEDLSTW